ncbi:hypothetical protein ACEYYH_17260 [Microbacterium trichothecenolyticum]|uniref:hypothetical protein n=1 Tax=Microbacterium trichothecenolyticum TaxID=69370 RepID=UPI0035BE329A
MRLRTAVVAETDAAARGRELGSAFGPHYRQTAALYLTHFAELGIPAAQVRAIAERSREALAAWAPGLAAESDAIADAADVERWRLAAVAARTEILAAAPPRPGECSRPCTSGPVWRPSRSRRGTGTSPSSPRRCCSSSRRRAGCA